MKFPMEHEIGEVKGDQTTARQCYVTSCRSKNKEALIIEDLREDTKMQRGEPVEDLVSIEVYPGEENKTVRISSNLKEDTKLELVNLLRTYADIFAWTAADMPGIDPEIITHRLNVDPSKKPVKQKKRTFAPERQEKIEEEIKAIQAMMPPKTVKQVQELTGRVAALGRFMARSAERCSPFFKAIRKAKNFVWTDDCQKSFEELKTHLGSPPLLSKPFPGEDLLIYLSVTEVTVSTVLIREEDGVQKPIYYVSKVLQAMETRYLKIDKIALALIISARRLRPYFQSHTIVVLTDQPLRKVLLSPEASGRLVDSLSVHSDSQLVVNHVLRDYEARDERMAQYLNLVKNSAVKFQNFTIRQIPRDQNTQADTLSRLVSAEEMDVRRPIYLEFLKDRSISSQTEVETIEQEPCWMDMIVTYLSTGELPSEKHEARNLRVKAARYALVEDYFTKWTEAESLETITSAKCEDFFWKNVVCHFGVPRALVVDNGKQFDNNNFRTFCTNLSIDLRFTSVAHPQSNGQTENMNRSILQGLKKKLDEAKGAWVDKLPKVLWAY
ncbi:hypothetical protein RJ639_023128 [Escallonia herrerae]|uniref:Integrase catalytic domain-containing protein n=1 Tax=Escallonia herrerae TaxID=1293975 RepID=A0AA89AEV2_9ASTE|nr:hypothetical protein RJ639_023128 [Escallonia herrerae]